ncbi:hypothetical protein [Azospirillum sp.]|uniref:hypothetical protein n=1 Tax=Azospirillum sp. TaxID=34012 RepID=UPI002D2E9D49|nr:hypothetical protein [Azospirillum sp.]HYD64813.1 hypothetical protein [Azospirillum sp.]
MDSFSEFDEILGAEASDDYWSDELVVIARDVVTSLSDADWNTLNDTWRRRSGEWQERLASVLSWVEPARATPLLVTMIESEDDALSLAAADSLGTIAAAVPASSLSPAARARLEAIAGKGRLNAMVVDNLLKRLIP